MNYTVLLRFPDTTPNWPDDMFLAHVTADTLRGALAAAQQQASNEYRVEPDEDNEGGIAPDDFALVAIFEGHTKGLAFAATGIRE